MGVWQNLKMRFSKRSGYDSGSFARGGENWTPVDGRAEDINVMSRDTIRHRARDLERNADYVEAAILAMERNGITPACAGKSNQITPVSRRGEDHPRVCGEK